MMKTQRFNEIVQVWDVMTDFHYDRATEIEEIRLLIWYRFGYLIGRQFDLAATEAGYELNQRKDKPMIKIDELTIKEAREISRMFGGKIDESPWAIGANYFIRTVTHHHTGKLVAVTAQELVLENAAWIADDGRLTNALAKCEFNEVEMFPENSRVIIGRGALIDAVEIASLPASQK